MWKKDCAGPKRQKGPAELQTKKWKRKSSILQE
jgi:hypothetical protein